jgi:pantoate--beta-alanine ligase
VIRVETVAALQSRLAPWRDQADPIALVPTMGNLHAGHLRLVREARQRARRVVVSLFVNPLQFVAGEDFDRYPRTLSEDQRQLQAEGVDLLFAPTPDDLYPQGLSRHTRVHVPQLADILCGAQRPGHFDGVATVVCKLFNLVRPDLALFGEKDYQQLLVIRRMVSDLALPMAIQGVATVREADGLALSSRNGYLDPAQRQRAPVLYRELRRLAERLAEGEEEYPALEGEAAQRLAGDGLPPDYVAIRRADDLQLPQPEDRELVVLAAVRLGATRLIDNIQVSCQRPTSDG